MTKQSKTYLESIGDILWSIFPENATKINYYAQIYDEHSSFTIDFIVNDEVKYFGFGETPRNAINILDILESYKSSYDYKKLDEKWTHCCISLDKNRNLDIICLDIDNSDCWPGLYMKGISDLTEDELKGTGIPKELWEERVFYKDSGQLGKLQSYFINKERREEFSNLTDDQYIYQQIAELLRSIAPSNQCNLVLSGYVKNQLSQLDFHQVMDNGQTLHIDMSSDELLTLLQLLEDLQNCEIFAKEPWTHFHITLDKDDKFKMGFSYEN